MKERIYVVEDEPSILDNVLYSLETEGFAATGYATGQSALAAFQAEEPDLMVLDVGLPDVSGFDLCKDIRKTSQIPIIFLTARSDEIDRIVGLEIGGDDYVTKPFSPRELSARVRAILRRTTTGNQPQVPAAAETGTSGLPFHVDDERVRITFYDEPLTLSSTEFRLLRALCQHPGRVYSRSQLMDLAWTEPDAAMERTVDAHIKSVRAKLREVRDEVDPIETHRGIGYSLREQW